jgi:hypothetical protein
LLCGTLAALLAAGGAWALLGGGSPAPENASPEEAPDLSFGSNVRMKVDDSGFAPAEHFVPPIKDPADFEEIRQAYDHLGYRGAAHFEALGAAGNMTPQEDGERQLLMTVLYLYEGDTDRAATVLEKLRARALTDPDIRPGLPTIIYLQGITSLRRAENENCVQNCCQGSCIFPIQASAIHKKRQGARDAVRYFTEYIRQRPDDLVVRWLLNISYMVLGEYPDGVPSEYRLPLDPMRSEFDIGHFTDVAKEVGIDRFNQAGMGIVDDFDNDGWLDLVMSSWDPAQPMAYYHNKGDGTFEDRTKGSGLEKQLGGLTCFQTDYNNDGWLDVYVCRGGWRGVPVRHSLLRNNKDGTFTDVTKQAGLDFPVDGMVAAWADYDNDGHLDVFIAGETTRSRLYHNRGDGTFEEVALKAGMDCTGVYCKGATWGDYDGDGYPDLFITNKNGPDRLYHNNRDGTFTDVAPQLGIAQHHEGYACWFFDYDNDGWPDIFAVSYEQHLEPALRSQLGLPHKGVTCRLYRNLGGKGFKDVSAETGMNIAISSMGVNFADFDNDGFLDIYFGTGTPQYASLMPNRMFKNVQGKRFADITMSSGTGHLQKGHGVSSGDIRHSGLVDLFAEMGGATPGDAFHNALFQNPGQGNHSLTVKLVGRKTNRPAIGARIKAVVAGPAPNTFYRHVTNGSSWGTNPLQQTVGLAKATKVERLEIYWPTSGTTQVFRDVPADQAIEITEFAKDYRTLYKTPAKLPSRGEGLAE